MIITFTYNHVNMGLGSADYKTSPMIQLERRRRGQPPCDGSVAKLFRLRLDTSLAADVMLLRSVLAAAGERRMKH